MVYWHTDALDLNDPLNQTIWDKSPETQSRIDQALELRVGAVGSAQGMVGKPPLQWVPDLVGKEWRASDAVIVYGSSYADFFTEYARRGGRMALTDYRDARGPAEFLEHFLHEVVTGDDRYYDKVVELLVRADVPTEQVVLTDLCRASFVKIIPGKSDANEGVLKAHKRHFFRYVEANRRWHQQRLAAFGGRVLVGLGKLATWGICHLLEDAGWKATDGWTVSGGRLPWSWIDTVGEWWSLHPFDGPDGRKVQLLSTPHPSPLSQGNPADMANDLAKLREGKHVEPRFLGKKQDVQRGSQPPAANKTVISLSRDDLWRAILEPAIPVPATHVLASHPQANQLTRRLLSDPSATRVVAVANAIWNPCNPSKLSTKGDAAAIEAWAILLDRKDTPGFRKKNKWRPLVEALEPIPEWAAVEIRQMDIERLGSLVQALKRGAYDKMPKQ